MAGVTQALAADPASGARVTPETPAYVELRLEDMVDRVVTGLAWLTPAEARAVAAGLLVAATACDGQRPCCYPLEAIETASAEVAP